METFLICNVLYWPTVFLLIGTVFLIFRFILKAKTWFVTDVIAIPVPAVLWPTLYELRLHRLLGHSKTLSNLLEPIWIGILCSVVFLLRSLLARKYPGYSRRISLYALLAMVLVTVAVYLFTPGLPE